ncbi:molecular chaperone [Shewanella intestini]|uniref:Molecular chaperone n=1 Tax=Shewanella intestini TaxID=2017544 RepID=A0ABS5I161_9GAMM|nr:MULTISPECIES: molecular chaperone [Shewanella]MBR9727656.1 molecular chaperone [Shewanella intestini]MRG35194.1 cytoplasmic chaperone TorD family protein [Shewanella sp. XMDDZSB0408]
MKNETMIYTAAACRILHNLYYNKPNDEFMAQFREEKLHQDWPILGDSKIVEQAVKQIDSSLSVETNETILRDYYRLIIGPGKALAFPWGSVYTDRENIVCGETNIAFENFCHRLEMKMELEFNEPWDHIGLILGALAQIIEAEDEAALKELMEVHLMPWAPRFLELFLKHAQTNFYKAFAILTGQVLSNLMIEKGYISEIKTLYL